MIQRTDGCGAVGRVQKQLPAFGYVKRRKPKGQVGRPRCGNHETPDPASVFDAPCALAHCVVRHGVLHAKAPRRLLVTVGDAVFLGKCGPVDGREVKGFGAGAFRPRRTAVGDLGNSKVAPPEEGGGKGEGGNAFHAGVFNGRCRG